jgi:3-oxoadipate enol-lactonase
MKVKSDDADIFYNVLGEGPSIVLLHAFPVDHALWQPVAERLATRYRVVLMDLRGHGGSDSGQGPATMEKHANDVVRVCDAAGVGKAAFGGVSIGGYVLLEFWRRYHPRVAALILADTRAQADSEQARAARLQAADDVEKNGPDAFLDSLVPKLLGETTRRNRPDLVASARVMMNRMTVAGIAAVQRGMAVRPDSVPTLSSIDVPTLLLFGDEDTVTSAAYGELLRCSIPNSRLQIVPQGGHFAVFERPDDVLSLMRNFLDELPR